MKAQRRQGVVYSALLHLLFLLVGIFGLPILVSESPVEPMAISVEVLPISELTNVKPAEAPPAKEEKPEPPKEQAKPAPPVKTEKAPPPPPKVAEKAKEKPKDAKTEPKPADKKDKPSEEDLDAVLKAVRDTAQKQKEDKKSDKSDGGSKNKSVSNQYDPTQPLSMSEMDAIRAHFTKCWNVPAGAKDAQNLVILVYAEFTQDGNYTKVELAQDERRYTSDSFFRAAADAAIRAVKQCSPLPPLPADKYSRWRALELRFDPKEMLQ